MKKLFVLILLFSVIFSNFVFAIEIELKENFNQDETFLATISGNFEQSLQDSNIAFYRRHIPVPLDISMTKIENKYYLYASLEGKQSDNYSLVIEDARYYQGTQILEEPITKNFMISNQTTDFSISALGFTIEIIRSYNSQNKNFSSGFGYGWTYNYHTYLIDKQDYVLWIDGDGSFHNYTALGNGNYSAPAGVFTRLNKQLDGSYSLFFKTGTTYDFDGSGILQKITDRNGNNLTFSYTDFKLTKISDDSGLQVDLIYNDENQITSITDPLGREITYQYDSFGNLINVTDAMGYSMQYLYYCCHKLANVISKENTAVIFIYDEEINNRVVNVRNAVYNASEQKYHNPMNVLLVNYDFVNKTVYALDANNHVSVIKLNTLGNPVQLIDQLNQSTSIGWSNNSVINVTDANGNYQQLSYDEYGNLETFIDPFYYETYLDWNNIDTQNVFQSRITNISEVDYTPGTLTQIFFDDMSSPDPGWVSNGWISTSMDFVSPPLCWACKNPDPMMGYGEGWYATLQMPPVNLSGYVDAELSFWHRVDFEDDFTLYDGGNVKISTDGGQTWSLIFPENGYDGKIVYSWGANPMEVQHAFGHSFFWRQERFNLSSYVGMAPDVRLRFEMGTNANPSGDDGWFIDDVKVMGYTAQKTYSSTTIDFDVNGNPISIENSVKDTATLNWDFYGNVHNVTDFRGYTTSYTYDSHGNLLTLIDAQGNTSSYEYDDVGRLLTFTNANGYTTRTFYDANDHIIKIRDATGNETHYEYSATGSLEAIINARGYRTNYTTNLLGEIAETKDPMGNTTSYAYAPGGEQVSKTAANGGTTSTGFDQLGRPTRKTDALGNSEWYGYDAVGNIIWKVDKNNGVWHYEYDKLNRLTRIIDPLYGETVYTYDYRGLLVGKKDKNGNPTTYEYDALNRLIKINNEPGCGCNIRMYSYDANGNKITSTDANNHTTTYEYDSLNRVIRRIDPLGNSTSYSYDAVGNQLTLTDKKGYTSMYTYDPLNRLTSMTDPLGNTTTYSYDAMGNLQTVINPRGFTTTYEYDALNRRITTTDATNNSTFFMYDELGHLTHITDANGYTVSYTYDLMGRVSYMTDPRGYNTSYEYDPEGNILKITDGRGNIDEYTYDALNRMTRSGNTYIGNYVRYFYDNQGNIIGIEDANLGRTQYSYDENNRLITITPPSGVGVTTYTYDNNGNVLQRTDGNNVQTNYTYDALNRVVFVEYPTSNISFSYDANSNYKTIANTAAETIQHTYDALNRVVSSEIDFNVFNKTLNYTYDAMGNVKTVTDPADGVTTYTYDCLNRLKTITDPTADAYVFTYDNISRRTQLTYPTNAYTTYKYDEANNLLNITTCTSADAIISSYNYTYDQVGNRMSMTDQTGKKTSYVYDQINRLTKTNYPAGTTVDYTYDGAYNRLTKTINSSSTTHYSYDGENKLTFDGTYTYHYDGAGNLISKSDGVQTTTYAYNYENQLTQVTLPDSSTVTYQYYAIFDRFSRTNTTETIYYLYEREDLLMELDNTGALISQYTHGPYVDEPFSICSEVSPYYYHYDGLGSITMLTDSAETVVNTYTYEDYGSIHSESETVRNNYKYTGREHDSKTGLYYHRLRYYQPDVGRFITKDPLGMIQGPNLYVYVEDNPVNFVDPFGEKAGSSSHGTVMSRYREDDDYRRCIKDAYAKKDAKLPSASKKWRDPKVAQIRRAIQQIDEYLRDLRQASKELDRANRNRIIRFVGQYVIGGIAAFATAGLSTWAAVGVGALIDTGGTALVEGLCGEDALTIARRAGQAGATSFAGGSVGSVPGSHQMFGDAASAGLSAAQSAAEPDNDGPGLPVAAILAASSDPQHTMRTLQRFGRMNAIGGLGNLVDYSIKRLEKAKKQLQQQLNSASLAEGATGAQGMANIIAELEADIKKCNQVITHLGKGGGEIPPVPGGEDDDDDDDEKDEEEPDPPQITGGNPNGGKGKGFGGEGLDMSSLVFIDFDMLEPNYDEEEGPWHEIYYPGPPKWPLILYEIEPNGGGGGGQPPGEGGGILIESPPGYCEYRLSYFSSKPIDDIGENQKALHNAIKWTARHPDGVTTVILLMPSWGGYDGYIDWIDFSLTYPDIVVLRWSDKADERATVTYAGLQALGADVLVDSDHALATQQGGFYTEDEIQAIQSYLLDEHGYIATCGTLGDAGGQSTQTDDLLALLGLDKSDGEPTTYTNSNTWVLDNKEHPIFHDISSGWNPGDVTANVAIGVCPGCGEKHLGSQLAHLETSSGAHNAVISAYQLWYGPQSTNGLLSDTNPGDCITAHQTVYFGNRVVDDVGNNHEALYNAIKWAAEHDNYTNTTAMVMPGWGGYQGWSSWQTFNTTYSDITITRWSDQHYSRDQVTIHGLDFKDVDVLIECNHSSPTQQGGFYSSGELQAIEWYVKTKGHGLVVTHGSLGDQAGQTDQRDTLLELLELEKTGSIETYANSNNWTIDQPYHPILYGLDEWNSGPVTGEIDVNGAVQLAHLYSSQGSHKSIISANEGYGKGACVCNCTQPAVDYILITDALGGTEIPDQKINYTTNLTGYASAYNNTYGFIDSIFVNWTVENSGSNASVCPDVGFSSMFMPGLLSGDATWQADDLLGHADTVSFEVEGVADTISPEITNISVTTYAFGNYINISCDVTDNVEVDTVTLNVTGPDGFDAINTTMSTDGGSTYYHNQSYPVPGTYYYFIWANDTSDNRALSGTFSFIIQPPANNPPEAPSEPDPINAQTDVSLTPTLSVLVIDSDGESLDVYFYNASDGSLIGSDLGVANTTRGSTVWAGLTYSMVYSWYAVADDGEDTTQSATWSFTTMDEPNNCPDVPSNPDPFNDATDVNLSPTLSVLVTDPDGHAMDVYFYNASDDVLIGSDLGVTNATMASVVWPDLTYNTVYSWYATADDQECQTESSTWTFTTKSEGVECVCGDANNDSAVNVGDAVYLINYVFKGGPPPQPLLCCGDANGDVNVNVGDAVYLINYVFKGGPPPVSGCCVPPW